MNEAQTNESFKCEGTEQLSGIENHMVNNRETIDWTDRLDGKHSFVDRFADAYMGKTIQSDMTFVLESSGTLIPAHSWIICAASPVLERLVHGTGSIVNTDRVVTVPDCSLAEFNVLLRYLYSGKHKIHMSFYIYVIQYIMCVYAIGLAEKLNIETARALLPLVHYFNLQHFENICVKLLGDSLSTKNVCETYGKLHLLDIPLNKSCLKKIQSRTSEMLADGSLMQMPDTALSKILCSDKHLNITNESEIFGAMLDWADKQCSEHKLLPSPANRRLMLKDRIYLIRFGAMNLDAFGKCLSSVKDGFFSDAELSDIMKCISLGADKSETKIAKPFRCDRRFLITIIPFKAGTRFASQSKNVIETIYIRNPNDNLTILGFKTKYKLTEITNDSNAIKLDFGQELDLVKLSKPLEFKNGQVAFKIIVHEKCTPFFRSQVELESKSNVFIREGSLSLISTIFYR